MTGYLHTLKGGDIAEKSAIEWTHSTWHPTTGRDKIWMGVSVENDYYTHRMDHLWETSAAVKFVSLEPLLAPVPSLDLTDIDWVIVGGASASGYRKMEADWVRDVRDVCQASDTAFFFKQWGAELQRLEGANLTAVPTMRCPRL